MFEMETQFTRVLQAIFAKEDGLQCRLALVLTLALMTGLVDLVGLLGFLWHDGFWSLVIWLAQSNH